MEKNYERNENMFQITRFLIKKKEIFKFFGVFVYLFKLTRKAKSFVH